MICEKGKKTARHQTTQYALSNAVRVVFKISLPAPEAGSGVRFRLPH
jgi:hypothetical protein